MNSLKRFIVASVLVASGVASALACGPWVRPHYYVFSAYQRNMLGETFTSRMEEFWFNYAPEVRESPWDISGLGDIDPQKFDKSTNPIVRQAYKKNDAEMIDYLRLLSKYMQVSNSVQDTWEYPTKEELAKRTQDLQYIKARANSYRGHRLEGQYCLLVMRCNMMLENHKANIGYWNKNKSVLPASVYKDMMKDIYAGALLHTGKTQEACDIYYELGDMGSLMWIMRDNRNLAGIKKEYARDPNSPALIYLVQDFVNNASDSHYSYLKWDEDNVDGIASNNKDMSDFNAFAAKVLKEGKTNVPALWQSGMGWLNHQLGNSAVAIEQLNKAMKMKGTERMLDNARVCRLVATGESDKPSAQLYSFLEEEFKWMDAKAKVEPSDASCYNCEGNHYTEVMQNLIYDSMAPRFQKMGLNNVATALVGWQVSRDDDRYEYWRLIDNMTAAEMIDYNNYLNGSLAHSFESTIAASCKMSADYFNDQVGTKMIREGHFGEAIPYLEKVSMQFLSQQAIAPYAALRDYHEDACLVRQHKLYKDFPLTIITNQKLDFCKEMVTLKMAYDQAGDEVDPSMKAGVAYMIANSYLQASYRGNCWYISRYGNSVYDTVEYNQEVDFVAEAAHWYEEALKQPGLSAKEMQHYLYANAFVPYGDPYCTMEYDENYKLQKVYNPASRQYKALVELKQFTGQLPKAQLETYVTKCDILKRFLN